MNSEQTRQLVEHWTRRVDAAAQNLLDLQSLAAYQRLTGMDGSSPVVLTGVTAARVGPALAAMQELSQHFSLLHDTVENARYLWTQMPRLFGSEQRFAEIERLLSGNSILLPPVETPLGRRDLGTSPDLPAQVTPQRLFDGMTIAFQQARDAVTAVEDAWNHLEWTLAGREAQANQLRDRARQFGETEPPEYGEVLQIIRPLRSRIESDPLGVDEELRQVAEPALDRFRKRIEAREELQRKLRDGFAAAHGLLQQLAQLRDCHAERYATAREKFAGMENLALPLPAEQVTALREWLSTLEQRLQDGLLEPLEVGLRHWMSKAEEYALAAEQGCEASAAPLRLRDELRGRFSALQAKAVARGQAENRMLVDLAAQVKQALFTSPTSLESAGDLLRSYERQLNGRPAERP